MTRKSSSTQQRQRSTNKPAGSGRSRGNSSGNQQRLSASGPRGSARPQPDRDRPRSERAGSSGRGRQRDDNQDWNFSQPQREYDESRRGGERSFGSADYEQGRARPAYSSQEDRGGGFTSPDSDRRREFAARGGRSGQGRFENPGQNERRFTREMDSYYGRAPRPQESRERSFRGDDDFRSSARPARGDWPQNSREDEYRSSQSRYQQGRSNHDDYDRPSYQRDEYSSGARQPDDRDDFRREEGYEDRGDYQGSSRESGRYSQEDDDRFYAGRGQRGSERESSGQRRQSGSRSGRATSGRRRD